MGVFDAQWIPVILEVLRELGSNHVLVVAAEDGLDEISIAAATEGEITRLPGGFPVVVAGVVVGGVGVGSGSPDQDVAVGIAALEALASGADP